MNTDNRWNNSKGITFDINILITIFFVSGSSVNYEGIAQSSIDYGSNNGKYIEIDHTNIYYEEYGEGTPTILLHGGLGSMSDFQNVIPELAKHFGLIAIDSPGHGRSQSIDSMSYQILADYIVELVAKLELEKVNIIGQSDGAIIGMLVANMVPEKIEKLVFAAGALNLKANSPEGGQLLRSTTPEVLPENFAISYRASRQTQSIGRNLCMIQKKCGCRRFGFPKKYCRR